MDVHLNILMALSISVSLNGFRCTHARMHACAHTHMRMHTHPKMYMHNLIEGFK